MTDCNVATYRRVRRSTSLLTCLGLALAGFLTACGGSGDMGGRVQDAHQVPVVRYGASEGAGSAGAHIVRQGDTAYDISRRYNIPLRALIDRNNLVPPYQLTQGQRLMLPPPNTYTVREGDNLYRISLLFDISLSQLVRQNNLESPFIVQPGRVLTLPYMGESFAKAESGSRGHGADSPVSSEKVARHREPSGKEAKNSAATKSSTARFIPGQPPPRSSSRFQWPVRGRIISGYGPKKGGLYNDGINISMPRGTSVRVAENGVVLYSGNELEGYGNLVLVKHAENWVSAYAHLDKSLVKKGQQLTVGEALGTVGSSGQVEKPQLHFEIRHGSKAVDPLKHLTNTN